MNEIAAGVDTETKPRVAAEWRWGAAQDFRVAAFITVVTGIGGALIIDSEPVKGLLRPEFCHMFIPRQRHDRFVGTCPVHGDCFEGFALERRLTDVRSAEASLEPVWERETDYLALALVNLVTIISPEIVVLGGGVTRAEGLLAHVQRKTRGLAAGYLNGRSCPLASNPTWSPRDWVRPPASSELSRGAPVPPCYDRRLMDDD